MLLALAPLTQNRTDIFCINFSKCTRSVLVLFKIEKTTFNKINFNYMKIGIIGLGYVGLPLAALFARKYRVVGF
jgi:hypothetical protein